MAPPRRAPVPPEADPPEGRERRPRRRSPTATRRAPEFRVSRIRPVEWRRYRTIRLRALRTDPDAYGSTLEGEQAFPASRWIERARAGGAGEGQGTFVAVDRGDRWRGLVTVLGSPEGVRIVSLWLDPALRGRGFGGRLLDAALRWAQRHLGSRPIRLDVNPRQRAAVELYRSRGFVLTEVTEPLGHAPGGIVRRMERVARSRSRRAIRPSGKNAGGPRD